ncbi:unnamed protein product [Phaeothamnion confervicola]
MGLVAAMMAARTAAGSTGAGRNDGGGGSSNCASSDDGGRWPRLRRRWLVALVTAAMLARRGVLFRVLKFSSCNTMQFSSCWHGLLAAHRSLPCRRPSALAFSCPFGVFVPIHITGAPVAGFKMSEFKKQPE